MASYSQYKNLELPTNPEHYNINIFNKNTMVIDSELHKLDIKNKSQDELLATKESLNSEITRSTTKENDIIEDLASEIVRAKSAENSNTNDIANEATRAMMTEEYISTTLQNHISDESNPHNVTKEQLELSNVDNTSDIDKPVSTAQQNALDSALSTHNTSDSSHNDIRLLIQGLTTRLNTLADSDDTTLDQLSEIVAYIKNNKFLIDGITTSKVNVSDIVDDLTTNSGNKVLSAKQGAILKGLIVDLTELVGNKVDKVSGKGLSTNDFTTSEKNKLKEIASGAEVNVQSDWNVTDSASDAFIKNKPTSMPASDVPSWAKTDTKPTYTKSEIGLGNVENKSSAAIREELTKENVTNALGYTPPETNIGYTHPTTSGNKHIPSGGSSGKILRWSSDGTAVWDNETVPDISGKVNRSGDTINGILNVGDKLHLFTDSESGTVEITSHSGDYGFHMDSHDDNLRIYCFKKNPWTYLGEIKLYKDGTVTSSKGFNFAHNGFIYSDSEPTSNLVKGITWIGT